MRIQRNGIIRLKTSVEREVKHEKDTPEISTTDKMRNEIGRNKPKNPQWNKWNKMEQMEQMELCLDITLTLYLLVVRKKKEIKRKKKCWKPSETIQK